MFNYTAPDDLLADRVILITGAGGGLGAALSRACAAHGAVVVLLGKTLRRLNAVYDAIEQAGGPTPAIYPLDLRGASEHDYQTLGETLQSEFGRLDGLVHTAAMLGDLRPTEQFDLQVWNTVLHVNLTAPMLLTRACLPALRASGSASVIYTLDAKTRAYWGAYGVSKEALAALTRILAHEFDDAHERAPDAEGRARIGIRVNAVDPGPMRTSLRASAYPGEVPTEQPEPATRLAPFLYLLGPESAGRSGEILRWQNAAAE